MAGISGFPPDVPGSIPGIGEVFRRAQNNQHYFYKHAGKCSTYFSSRTSGFHIQRARVLFPAWKAFSWIPTTSNMRYCRNRTENATVRFSNLVGLGRPRCSLYISLLFRVTHSRPVGDNFPLSASPDNPPLCPSVWTAFLFVPHRHPSLKPCRRGTALLMVFLWAADGVIQFYLTRRLETSSAQRECRVGEILRI